MLDNQVTVDKTDSNDEEAYTSGKIKTSLMLCLDYLRNTIKMSSTSLIAPNLTELFPRLTSERKSVESPTISENRCWT